jgi:Rrf2 family protein
MKLSTRGRYGLRAMLELAIGFEKGPVLMRSISENQEISLKYLHSLLTTLKGAGLVRSVRGKGGGYMLTRAPSEIRISEVVKVLEGSLTLVECVKDKSLCRRAEHCVAREVWQDLGDAIENTLSGLTLYDLLIRMKKKEPAQQIYYTSSNAPDVVRAEAAVQSMIEGKLRGDNGDKAGQPEKNP